MIGEWCANREIKIQGRQILIASSLNKGKKKQDKKTFFKLLENMNKQSEKLMQENEHAAHGRNKNVK